MTQRQLARAAAVGRQWIVAIEAGKPRAELGKVLQTLAALDLSLTMHGEGIPEARESDVPIEVVDPGPSSTRTAKGTLERPSNGSRKGSPVERRSAWPV